MEFEITLIAAPAEIIEIDNYWKKEMDGIPIKVKGFEFLDLFAYQRDASFRTVIKAKKGDWLIAERNSGLTVSDKGCQNIEQAYFELSEKLNNIGIEICKKALEKNRQKMPFLFKELS